MPGTMRIRAETTTRRKPLFNRQRLISLITLSHTITWGLRSIDRVSLDAAQAANTPGLGTALYRQSKFREATRAFQVSLLRHSEQTEDILNRSSILYNLGNAQFKVGDLTGAIASYEQALRLDPQDANAQHNLALALQLLRQQEDLAQQQANKSTAPKTEPNDIGRAEALRLLERFSENENRLRQKLLQQQRKSGYRREKDW